MKSPLPKELYQKSAAFHKLLGNTKRLEILYILRKDETSVEDLLKITKLPKTNMSQHLALLRRHGLIAPRREGLRVFYKIIDPRVLLFIKV